jgi:hypothetical protein
LSIGPEQKDGTTLASGSNAGWGCLRVFGSGAEGRDRSVENEHDMIALDYPNRLRVTELRKMRWEETVAEMRR